MKNIKGNIKLYSTAIACVFALVLLFGVAHANAEDISNYPSKPIVIQVNSGAGGGTDRESRNFAPILKEILGQPVIIRNKPGGMHVIGLTALYKTKPDGYTICLTPYSGPTIVPHLRKVAYNTKNFTFIMQSSQSGVPFSVQRDSPYKDFNQFLEFVRTKPPKTLNYITSGPLGGQHIFMEAVFKKENVQLNHVPGKGGAEVVQQILGGHLIAGMSPSLIPHAMPPDGRLRVLGFMTPAPYNRHEFFPDVPTFYEMGYTTPCPLFYGIIGPPGMDPAIVKKLHDAFKKAWNTPEMQAFYKKEGKDPVYKNSEDFKSSVSADYDAMGETIKQLGLVKK